MKTMMLLAAMLTTKAQYAHVNGLDFWYFIEGSRGSNPPLVLLHGGDPTIETSFGKIMPLLAKQRQLIGFDQAGHGHTADRPEPFSFEQSADDAAALLEKLGVKQADFYGYSNGGTIALQIAIRHPNLVHKLVVQSANYRSDGMVAGFWDGMRQAKTIDSMPKEYRDTYVRIAPHPEQLQSYFEKSLKRMLEFKDIPDEQIKSIQAPVFVMIGDRDVIRPEHALQLVRLLPHAQLAILPNSDHMQMAERAEWEAPLIEEFLSGK